MASVGHKQFESRKDELLATALDAIKRLRKGEKQSELERILHRHVGHIQPLTDADLATL